MRAHDVLLGTTTRVILKSGRCKPQTPRMRRLKSPSTEPTPLHDTPVASSALAMCSRCVWQLRLEPPFMQI